VNPDPDPIIDDTIYVTLTDVAASAVVGRQVFLVAPTEGAVVHLDAFAKLDDVTAICGHVTLVTDDACPSTEKHKQFHAFLTSAKQNRRMVLRIQRVKKTSHYTITRNFVKTDRFLGDRL